jgi:hypothetical protein
MIDWDALPFQPQPTQPAAGQLFEYAIPEGRIGRLYWITVKLVCGTPNEAIGRRLHMELGGITFMPGGLAQGSNQFGKIGHLNTGSYFMAPGIPQYIGMYEALQCAPMMTVNEIMHDHTYQIKTYMWFIQPNDQITVNWAYKEQDWK